MYLRKISEPFELWSDFVVANDYAFSTVCMYMMLCCGLKYYCWKSNSSLNWSNFDLCPKRAHTFSRFICHKTISIELILFTKSKRPWFSLFYVYEFMHVVANISSLFNFEWTLHNFNFLSSSTSEVVHLIAIKWTCNQFKIKKAKIMGEKWDDANSMILFIFFSFLLISFLSIFFLQ